MSALDPFLPSDIAPDFAAAYRRLEDVRTYQLERLRGAPSAPLLQEYEYELNEAFVDLERRIESLRLATDDYDRSEEQRSVGSEANKIKELLVKVRKESREALLTTKRSLAARNEAAARAELKLDRDDRGGGRLANRSGGDDKLHTAAEDVTDALRRTVSLMSQELEKSTFSAQMLDESSSSLRTLSLEYTSFSGLIKSSTQLIKSMERQDLYDRLMVLACLVFFVACVGYIFKVRIWDRGASLFGFLFRTIGLGRSGRSAQEVVEKLKMAKAATSTAAVEAAKSASQTLVDAAQTAVSSAVSAGEAVAHTEL